MNIEKFKPQKYPTNDKIKFLYIARVMKTKGIDEFLWAASNINNKNVEFQICGFCEEDF